MATEASISGEGNALTLSELAKRLGGEVAGDGAVIIRGVAGLEDAAPGTLVRVEQPRYLEKAQASECAALLIGPGLEAAGKPAIRVENVRAAFVRCLELFAPNESLPAGVHSTAVVGEGCEIDPAASIGAYAVLGDRVRVAAGATVHAHVVIGDGAEIGEGSLLFPNVTLYPRTFVGKRVKVHAGTVIGGDGFGYEWFGDHHHKVPQNGRVRLEDDVEIGANTTIDRATTGDTVIGRGTKVDNLVQIAHNVRTGAHCLIVSQVGIAGSAVLGNGVVLGGQAGVKDHATIPDGVMAAGRTGVWGTPKPGSKISGNPDRPHREEVRIQASLGKVPDLVKRFERLNPEELKQRVEELERQVQALLEKSQP